MNAINYEKTAGYHSPAVQRRIRFISTKLIPRVLLVLMSLLFLLPYYFMLTTSIKSVVELRALPPTFFPHSFHIENYVEAVQYIPFFRFTRNSLILAVSCIIGSVISNSLIAYGFSRIQWPFREKVFAVVIATMFIPFPVILVALFDIYAKLRMVNSFFPLIIPSFMGSALYIFMLRQYLLTIPKEISDAGFIDGAAEFQIFWRLTVPLMQPAIAVVAIFTALGSWNDFMGPLIYLQNENLYPLSIGIQFFRTQHEVQYSMLMAASALVVLPVVVIFLLFQRFFVEGITIGALKG
ncbi:MAG: carbohydrate ABC transporter permease [Treponema sp.]|jgi:multiple sugar transport system permease protein|nr:carbohydrate ABC transporter permease [Treponema sp.]